MPGFVLHTSILVDKLVRLARGDSDLVQRAIRQSAKNGSAPLEDVVDFIVTHRSAL
jgi:hypothetical protein